MALDGTLLRQIKHELEGCLLNARVERSIKFPGRRWCSSSACRSPLRTGLAP